MKKPPPTRTFQASLDGTPISIVVEWVGGGWRERGTNAGHVTAEGAAKEAARRKGAVLL